MLIFNDEIYDKNEKYNDKKKEINKETFNLHNGLYSKYDLSDFILVDKKPKIKK